MAVKDYYNVLGISRTATEKEIKSAYRKLARKHHPDVNPGNAQAEERFKEIAEAYEVLSDPEMRKKYDQFGHLGDGWKHAAEAGGGFNFGQGRPGGAQWRNSNPGEPGGFGGGVDLSDLLGGMFGGGHGGGMGGFRGRQMATRGEDLEYEIEITLQEAYTGAERNISFAIQETCPTCRGMGVVNNRPCNTCGGAGAVQRPKTLTVKIPKGVKDGGKIRLSGQGGPGANGGAAGDLYLIPHILPDPRFERKDDDLSTEVPVTFPEAALGAEVEVPTMTGVVTAHVPAGTSSGQKMRLRGKGMPRLRSDDYGDLYVKIRIMTPKQLSERERELIEELQSLRTENPRQ